MNDYSMVAVMRESGMGYGAIAKAIGANKGAVVQYCRAHGLSGQKDMQGSTGKESLRLIEQNGLEYVSGELKAKSNCIVRNPNCGHEYQMCITTLRHHSYGYLKKHECPVCRSERQAQAEQAAMQRKAKRQWELEHKPMKAQQMQMRMCKRCGAAFIGTTKYCSHKCMQRATDSRKEFARRMRVKEQMVDDDISLEILYKRDNGLCYICGRQCNLDDYTVQNGARIVGETYPSIDHVVPLSKGGKHSWSNVKLACMRCNSKKSDKTYPLGQKK